MTHWHVSPDWQSVRECGLNCDGGPKNTTRDEAIAALEDYWVSRIFAARDALREAEEGLRVVQRLSKEHAEIGV